MWHQKDRRRVWTLRRPPGLESHRRRNEAVVRAARGRVRAVPTFIDRLPGKTFRVAFPELAHGNVNVLEGLIPQARSKRRLTRSGAGRAAAG